MDTIKVFLIIYILFSKNDFSYINILYYYINNNNKNKKFTFNKNGKNMKFFYHMNHSFLIHLN
ncbi:hypothetical protein M8044_000412 [Columbia Basin potato purple top phytoplasma]|uniref:Uncharacterized protein n=1 Tax=Columbia Basin potato purple top phytoplasma TaxID=307134 RepID=A0ABT5L9B6_9MOLU|nr:hypothetical protein [Columbia Basin potato purple top phytoplasma]